MVISIARKVPNVKKHVDAQDDFSYIPATRKQVLIKKGGQIAFAYKLSWNIAVFFGWWKRQLKVYHFIAGNRYGVMVKMIAGLITYLLLTICCHEKVSIKRVRVICIKIKNKMCFTDSLDDNDFTQDSPDANEQAYARS